MHAVAAEIFCTHMTCTEGIELSQQEHDGVTMESDDESDNIATHIADVSRGKSLATKAQQLSHVCGGTHAGQQTPV